MPASRPHRFCSAALERADRHPRAFAGLCALFVAAVTALCTPFDVVLREDAYLYLRKALEITRGDWTVHGQPIGWPMATALALKGFGVTSPWSAMVLARALSIAFMAATVFPLSCLARRLFDARTATLATLALATSPVLIDGATTAYTEPLFLLLMLGGVAALARRDAPARGLLVATVLGSLAFYVRRNGLLLLVLLLIVGVHRLVRRQVRWPVLLAVPLLFFLVSAPHLALRHASLGSPFSFGETSKYFADSYEQVFVSDIPVPTLGEYLATHDLADHFDKFVKHGLLKIGWHFYGLLGELWVLLLLFGALLHLRTDRAPGRGLPYLAIAVLLLGLVPAYQVLGVPRHLVLALPFAFVAGSHAFTTLVGARRDAAWLTVAFGLVLIGRVPAAVLDDALDVPARLGVPEVRDEWVHWSTENLEGDVAIIEGLDLLVMLGRPGPGGQGFRLRPFRPGPFPDLEQALASFRRRGFEYVMIDSANVHRRPYLRDVYAPEWSDRFELVRSFRSRPDQRWSIPDMDVFRIVE